jgi:hypothetical protein
MRRALAGMESAENRKILWWRIGGDMLFGESSDLEIWIVFVKTNRIDGPFQYSQKISR